MKLYGGIDLHSNSVVALLDEEHHDVYRKRLSNEAAAVLDALAPFREAIEGLVVCIGVDPSPSQRETTARLR